METKSYDRSRRQRDRAEIKERDGLREGTTGLFAVEGFLSYSFYSMRDRVDFLSRVHTSAQSESVSKSVGWSVG